MNEQTALAARIRENLVEIERVVERTQILAQKALDSGDDGYWDGTALNLHNFYGGVERILEDIARTIDGSLPDGIDWHRSLLVQMAASLPEKRIAVISRSARVCLDEYRGFRHVVRNIYAFNFKPARLQELVDTLPACFRMVHRDLESFASFLEGLK